jgi:hypothetical protein
LDIPGFFFGGLGGRFGGFFFGGGRFLTGFRGGCFLTGFLTGFRGGFLIGLRGGCFGSLRGGRFFGAGRLENRPVSSRYGFLAF